MVAQPMEELKKTSIDSFLVFCKKVENDFSTQWHFVLQNNHNFLGYLEDGIF